MTMGMTTATKRIYCLLFFLVFGFFGAPTWAAPPKNFTEAKKIARQIFSEHRLTLYCDCRYDRQQKIQPKSCGIARQNNARRAKRVEWEHMMPMHNITRQFPCGQRKMCINKKGQPYHGRQCCRQLYPEYRKIEGDLFNLWPAVGSVNRERSHYRFTQFSASEKKQRQPFVACEFYVDKKRHRVEPADHVKGIVARANLYMSEQYGISLSPSQVILLMSWNKQFPPNEWELAWAKKVAKIMGHSNDYIEAWRYKKQ